jgi:predicted amidophosphoribosyltransferase
MKNFSIYHILEYLPTRYIASSNQEKDRTSVYDFKNGYCNPKIFDELVRYINKCAGWSKSEYIICFIPASTQWKTDRRYSTLAQRLENMTGVKTTMAAIQRIEDKEAGHLNGGTINPTAGISFKSSYFQGKKVILIDDVITRGHTFNCIANALIDKGANDVIGLFVAKTINPYWKSNCA